jgi:hypothetical protein
MSYALSSLKASISEIWEAELLIKRRADRTHEQTILEKNETWLSKDACLRLSRGAPRQDGSRPRVGRVLPPLPTQGAPASLCKSAPCTS